MYIIPRDKQRTYTYIVMFLKLHTFVENKYLMFTLFISFYLQRIIITNYRRIIIVLLCAFPHVRRSYLAILYCLIKRVSSSSSSKINVEQYITFLLK